MAHRGEWLVPYGALWQVNASSPALTRLGDSASWLPGAAAIPNFLQVMPWMGVQRCNLLDNGTVSALYGDRCYTDTDVDTWGQCMTYIPVHAEYVDTTVANKVAYWIGQVDETITLQNSTQYTLTDADIPPGFRANGAIKDNIFMSSYPGYTNNGKLESVAGFQPTHETMTLSRQHAQARGAGWNLMTIHTLSVVQFLYIVMLANFDSVSMIGKGITDMPFSSTVDKSAVTGGTASLGNASGKGVPFTNADDGVSQSVSFMGMEDMWADCYRYVEGIIIGSDGTIYITPDNAPPAGGWSFDVPAGYNDTHLSPYPGPGYVCLTFDYSQPNYKWAFIPKTAVGWDTTSNTTDYAEGYLNVGYPPAVHIMVQGASWYSNGGQGIFANAMNNTYGWADTRFMGRLQYVPQ